MTPVDTPEPSVPVQPQDWEDAVRRSTVRLEADRGVADEWSVTREDGVLWVNYDRLRVRVGVDTDVQTEAQLFEELDRWVADDRPAGPGRWLARDAAALAEAEAAARRITPWVREAADRLSADLQNAWGVTTVWQVVQSRSDLPFPWPGEEAAAPAPSQPSPHEAPGFQVVGDAAGQRPMGWAADPVASSERPGTPEVKVLMRSSDGSGTGRTVPLWDVDDADDAVYELVDLFEDDLVDEVWGKWPTCPTHGRTLGLDRVAGAATWVCPRGNRPLARVGALTKSSHDSRPNRAPR